MCGCLSCTPFWGPGQHPRHVPWLWIKLATLWLSGWHSIHWSTPARVQDTLQAIKAKLFSGKNIYIEFYSVIQIKNQKNYLLSFIYFIFYPHQRTFFFIAFRERDKWGERDRKNLCGRETLIVCLLIHAQRGIEPATCVCDLTRNQTHDLLVSVWHSNQVTLDRVPFNHLINFFTIYVYNSRNSYSL